MSAPAVKPAPFPATYWTANVIELFERAAYYSMASFVVIYLGQLGLGDYWPSTLNSVLWFLVYFLPVLSGTVADQIGFRKGLLLATVLLVGGPVGAWLFNEVMCRGAEKVMLANGKWLLQLDPKASATGWIILTAFGLLSAASLCAYNAWLKKHPA